MESIVTAVQERSLSGLLEAALTLSIFWGIYDLLISKAAATWVKRQQWWWDRAISAQKHMLANFGLTNVSDDIAAEAYAMNVTIGIHHSFCGSSLLPVLLFGWYEAPDWARTLAVFGLISDVAWDIFDWVRLTLRCFAHKQLRLNALPFPAWFCLCVLHHPLSLSLVIPMLHTHPDWPEFHGIAAALLLAAGLCCWLSMIKFACDLTDKKQFRIFKVVALSHLLIIGSTRAVIFPWLAYRTFFKLRADADTGTVFFIAACICGTLIAFFNVLMVVDAFKVVAKWLPRSAPPKTKKPTLSASLLEGDCPISREISQDLAALAGSQKLFSVSSPSFSLFGSVKPSESQSMSTSQRPRHSGTRGIDFRRKPCALCVEFVSVPFEARQHQHNKAFESTKSHTSKEARGKNAMSTNSKGSFPLHLIQQNAI